MENLAIANMFVYIVVCSAGIIIGIDLKKWFSWFFITYGFLSGFWIGFLEGGVSSGFQLGALFVFVVVAGGAMTRYYRQQYGRMAAEDWLSRYGQEKQFSLLARVMQKILRK